MNTLAPHALATTTTDGHGAHTVRTVLRSTMVLVVALGLTSGVLIALSSVMDGWT